MKQQPLTKKEIDVVQKLSRGITVPEISAITGINKRTLETITDKMKKRYKCKTLAHLVATFIRMGIIK
jgi:DNA-binding CsgD family transcriptional regulator